MNKTQYGIVKLFTNCKISPERIAKEFKAPIEQVRRVAATNNYKQFADDNYSVEELLKSMFGGKL